MFGSIGYQEVIVIGVVAILLFGKRLPEVARNWGNSYRDLRRSLNDIKSSFAADQYEPPKSKRASLELDDRIGDSGPKFIPPSDVDADPQPKQESPTSAPSSTSGS